MAERHAAIVERIHNVEQLQAVVTAMRGIAAARAQRGRALLPAIDAYGEVVAGAIARTSPLLSPPAPGKGEAPRVALVAFCAEQGFAGAFSERILDAVAAAPPDVLVVVGTRGMALAAERGLAPVRTAAMANRAEAVPALATHLADMVYAMIAPGEVDHLDVLFARHASDGAIDLERRAILPLDMTRLSPPRGAEPPLVTLPPEALIDHLAAEYLFAELCVAAMHAFSAENEARLRAMAAARSNIEDRLATLGVSEKQLRQQEITSEIVELAAGADAARRG